jgi:rare lipoprotein A
MILKMLKKSLLIVVMMFAFTANANVNQIKQYSVVVCNDSMKHETGNWTATYYGNTYKGVRYTANGDRFNMNAMTCAAPKKYKFGTWLKVENVKNGKSVVVKVTDRGAFGNSNIDLAYGAFGKISDHRSGRIKIKVYDLGNYRMTNKNVASSSGKSKNLL